MFVELWFYICTLYSAGKIRNGHSIETYERFVVGGELNGSLRNDLQFFKPAAIYQVQNVLQGDIFQFFVCQVYDGCNNIGKNGWFQLCHEIWYQFRNDLIG